MPLLLLSFDTLPNVQVEVIISPPRPDVSSHTVTKVQTPFGDCVESCNEHVR